MPYKLGKKAARHAIKHQLADFFDLSVLPKPPAVFGVVSDINYHILGNLDWGDCVWAGAANEEYTWSVAWGRPRTRITTRDVLSDYAAVTGFKYTEASDQGTDMTVAAEYRLKTGILDAVGKRHKIDSYVALKVGDLDQLAFAVWLTGAVGVGVQLPRSAETQFDNGHQPWTVVKSTNSGGHYVPCVGRDKDGNFLIVTWGAVQPMTPDFYVRYNDEAICYLNTEVLGDNKLSPSGFDEDSLRKYMATLGGTS